MNALKGGLISIISAISQQLISLIGGIVLARILGPEDFGIYAIAFTVFLFFQSFIDFGLTPIYIKHKEVSPRINSLFLMVNFFFGLAVSIIIFFSAPFLAAYYDLPILKPLIRWQSIVPIILALSNQPFGQLLRAKSFKKSESISVISHLSAVAVGIGTALAGFGPMALVLKQIGYGVTRCIGAMVISGGQYVWVRPTALSEIKSAVINASELTASRLINGFTSNIDRLIIGKTYGEIPLGHYERSLFVVDKPNTIRNAITTPAMTYLARMSGKDISNAYALLSVMVLTIVGLPCVFFLFYGDVITLFILGDQWEQAGEFVRILSFLGLALIFKGMNNILHINELRTKRLINLHVGGFLSVFGPLLIAYLSLGLTILHFVLIYSIANLLYWSSIYSYFLRKFSFDRAVSTSATLYYFFILIFFGLSCYFLSFLFYGLTLPIFLELFLVGTASLLLTLLSASLLFPLLWSRQIGFIKDRI